MLFKRSCRNSVKEVSLVDEKSPERETLIRERRVQGDGGWEVDFLFFVSVVLFTLRTSMQPTFRVCVPRLCIRRLNVDIVIGRHTGNRSTNYREHKGKHQYFIFSTCSPKVG